jgi:hypothetical protein
MVCKTYVCCLIVMLYCGFGIQWYFFQECVWLACKKSCFEYHSLLDAMVVLEYMKFHSNPKFSYQ